MSNLAKKAAFRRVLKKLESMPKLQLYTKEDDLPDDKYFVQIPTDDAPELKIDGDDVFVGPFDTAGDAKAAADGQATVVNDEGTPVVDADPAAGDAGPPMDPAMGDDDNINGDIPMKTAESRKKFQESVRKEVLEDIKKRVEAEDTTLDVDTSVATGDEVDDGGSGQHANAGNPHEVADATPPDGEPVGEVIPDINADRVPSTNDAENAIPGAEDVSTDGNTKVADGAARTAGTGNSELDSNGGDITEGTIPSQFELGSFVEVRRGGKKIDSGVVEKLTRTGLSVDGTTIYDFKSHDILKLA